MMITPENVKNVNRTYAAIVLTLLFLSFLAYESFYSGKAKINVNEADRFCLRDTDCIFFQDSCDLAGCGSSINVRYAPRYENLFALMCKNYTSTGAECIHTAPFCLNNTCALKIPPEILIERINNATGNLFLKNYGGFDIPVRQIHVFIDNAERNGTWSGQAAPPGEIIFFHTLLNCTAETKVRAATAWSSDEKMCMGWDEENIE